MMDVNLIYGPDPIFSKVSKPIEQINEDVQKLCNQLKELLYRENAVGVAAPMIGCLKQIIAIDLRQSDKNNLIIMINPHIKYQSDETQVFEEASICFPGISAKVERPKNIIVDFLTKEGTATSLQAEGYLATVIQHEMDYLMGRTYLDLLSPIKRKMLLKKANKFKKQ